MDVQTGLVYVAVVVVSALVIGFVSVFAMKEKSYEEAIAEQRKLPDDLLLGKKEKGKEKKHKNKTGKKVKDKKEEKEEKGDKGEKGEKGEKGDKAEKGEKEEKSEHVQFEENPQILAPEPSTQESGKGSKKKGKVEKVKPILVNKDEPVVLITEPSPSQPVPSQEGNHFDVIQPKDDLELFRSHSRENLHLLSQSESTISKSPRETPTKVNKKNAKERESRKKDEAKEEKKEASSKEEKKDAKESSKELKEKPKDSPKEAKEPKEVKENVKETVIAVQSSAKESKKAKKKNDILSQIGGDKDGVNFALLDTLVQKAELSRSEIQSLIDQLLNKQQDNPLEHAEWTESRDDPIIKLKKQLAEKEKALKNETEAFASMQNKLLELRTELNGERSRLTATVRQLEEALSAKNTEVQTLNTRVNHILETNAAEKQGFSRQIEQLQSKINEDASIIAKMKEDQGQTQGQMQQELIAQRKQLEVHIAQLRDNEAALKGQLAQRQVEYQELQSVNMSMQQELQATCESSTHEIEALRHQLGLMQEQIMRTDGQLQHYKDTSERLQDVHCQLEESCRTQSELEHKVKNMHRHEQELKKQVTFLQSELDAAKGEAASLKEELEKVQKSDSTSTNESGSGNAEVTTLQCQLKAKEEELDKVQDELKKIQSSLKKKESEYSDALNELKSTKSELAKLQDNYKVLQNDLKKCQDELREVQKLLEQTQIEFSKLNNPSKDARSATELDLKIIRLQEDNERLSSQMGNVAELQKELKQLREKNELLTNQLSSVERLSADGKENGIEEKAQKNNIQLTENKKLLAQKEDLLAELKTALTQKEKEIGQLGSQVETLRSEVNNHRSATARLKDDLEQQRSKNNDLRRKNWKVMEALNSAESRIKNNSGPNGDAEKVKVEEQEATKALLQRIFPEIKVSEKSHDQWMKVFEEQIYTALSKLKADTKLDDASLELEKTNKNLQTVVNNYKQIINDTEGMLNQLQSHIESEEKRWQTLLRQKENEASNLRVEIHELQRQTSSHNELQNKISELESRLSEAESLKGVKSETHSLQSHSKNRVQDLAAVEQLQEEKARLAEELQNESSKRAILDAEIAKLRSLVESAESSLAQEKKIVSQLTQEMTQLKNEIYGSSSSDQSTLNGPPTTTTTDSPKSEPKIGARSLIAALEKNLLKNTELENCSLPETDKLVESRQDIDDSSLTSKIASNTSLLTDNVTQNSCNPLNGQQHKKHKKRRKGGSGKK